MPPATCTPLCTTWPGSIVSRFSFRWWDVPDRPRQSLMIEPVHPAERSQLDGLAVPPGLPVDDLGLVQPVDCLGQCIVVAVADAAGRSPVITPHEEAPQIDVIMANVMVPFPGADMHDENLVAYPLEQKLSEIGGIKHVYSVSRPGTALITVESASRIPWRKNESGLVKELHAYLPLKPPPAAAAAPPCALAAAPTTLAAVPRGTRRSRTAPGC